MDIISIIKNYEGTPVEYIKVIEGLPNSIWETYSSFANTNGGTILLGVEDVDKELFISGVTAPQNLIKTIWDTLNNPQKVSVNILANRHIYVENIDGMEVVVIEVPRADCHDKPVYIGSDCFGGCFRRDFEGDYRCTKPEVMDMLRDQAYATQDSKVLINMPLDALDMGSIRRYQMRFSNLKPNHVWNNLSQLEFLYKIGAIKRSEEDNKDHPTLAGLLMFGEEKVITDEFLKINTSSYDSKINDDEKIMVNDSKAIYNQAQEQIEGYFNGKEFILFDKVNVNTNQKVIITILDEYINYDEKLKRKERLMKTFGTWEDNRDVEQIISDIYASRVSRKDDIRL